LFGDFTKPKPGMDFSRLREETALAKDGVSGGYYV
jgi:hypothetical protein